ncbi:MAG: TolC family protein [Epsilonproteobacteria bacterium]|nr:TolC family protein [Campylobacterota bacterium]
MRVVNGFWTVVAAALLGGCAAKNVAEPARKAEKAVKNEQKAPETFVAAQKEGKVENGWLAKLGDSRLEALVAEAQHHNPDLRLALARLERAQAMAALSASGLGPRLDLTGSVSERSTGSDRGYVAAQISWEADIWGRIANTVAADEATMRAMAYEFAWARQSLAAAVARAWFLLSADKALHDFAQKMLKVQQKALDLTSEREKIGAGTKRDVHLMAGMRDELRARVQRYAMAWHNDTRALEALAGRYPANTLKPGSLPEPPALGGTGIPADLLNRRPDLVAARERVAAAFHTQKAMELLKLPRFRFSFQAGYDRLQDALLKFLGSVFVPVADNGKIDAYIAMANADQKAALAAYKQAVLRAFLEVEQALGSEKQLARRHAALLETAREYEAAYKMLANRYEIGEGDIMDLLTAQSRCIDAYAAAIRSAYARLNNRINLYLALGGDF